MFHLVGRSCISQVVIKVTNTHGNKALFCGYNLSAISGHFIYAYTIMLGEVMYPLEVFRELLFSRLGEVMYPRLLGYFVFNNWEKLCIPGFLVITVPCLGEVMYPRWLVYYCSTFGRSYVSQVVYFIIVPHLGEVMYPRWLVYYCSIIWEKLCIPGV